MTRLRALLFKQAGQIAGLAFPVVIDPALGQFAMALVLRPNCKQAQDFRRALPMIALSRHSQDAGLALGMSVTIGLAVSAAGCFDCCGREVG